MNRHELASYCELLRLISSLISPYLIHRHLFSPRTSFLSTDYHRFTQIFLISKDIVIITDYFLARKSTAFSKTRLLAPHWYNHGTSWLRLAGASSRLSLLCGNEPCLYFSIALIQIKPLPIAQPSRVFFKSRVHPCLKINHCILKFYYYLCTR